MITKRSNHFALKANYSSYILILRVWHKTSPLMCTAAVPLIWRANFQMNSSTVGICPRFTLGYLSWQEWGKKIIVFRCDDNSICFSSPSFPIAGIRESSCCPICATQSLCHPRGTVRPTKTCFLQNVIAF